jgi:predicted oxidoreductase (fatty acid repression mutant protein)
MGIIAWIVLGLGAALQEHNEQVVHDFDVPDAWSAAIEQQAP